jgi:hypothetical protein
MQITIDIPAEHIANMMVSAIESGDPVTSAAKGGWCRGIDNVSRKKFTGNWWYADAKYFTGRFAFDVAEYHEEDDTQTHHRINQTRVAAGLKIMAEKFPRQFSQIFKDDTDAPCADIFLQCVVFGEEKYA